MIMFQEAVPLASAGLIAAVIFFLIFAAIAYIAFRVLKKTVKLAFRMAIVAIILLIAIAGSVSFWWLGNPKTTTKPRATQTR